MQFVTNPVKCLNFPVVEKKILKTIMLSLNYITMCAAQTLQGALLQTCLYYDHLQYKLSVQSPELNSSSESKSFDQVKTFKMYFMLHIKQPSVNGVKI